PHYVDAGHGSAPRQTGAVNGPLGAPESSRADGGLLEAPPSARLVAAGAGDALAEPRLVAGACGMAQPPVGEEPGDSGPRAGGRRGVHRAAASSGELFGHQGTNGHVAAPRSHSPRRAAVAARQLSPLETKDRR